MKNGFRIPNLGGATALILHRPHGTVTAIERQLSAIGMKSMAVWTDIERGTATPDFIFFDVDLGYDEQFPWPPGEAPVPLIALIGSEAPGRIEWALSHAADAHLLKPVGTGGVYSTLLIARRSFDARKAQAAEIGELHARVAERQTIVQAVALLVARGAAEEQAYGQLRVLAMNWNVTIEEAAKRIVAWSHKQGEADEQSRIA